MKTQAMQILVGCLVFSMLAIPLFGEDNDVDYSMYEQVLEALEDLQPGSSLEVRLGTEKDVYTIGEPFEVRFMVSDACHMVLMDIGASSGETEGAPPQYGPIMFLAPSYKAVDNRLEPGKVYSTLYDFDLKFRVAPPSGYETVNMFCSPEPLELFEPDFEEEPLYTIMPDDTEKLAKLLENLQILKQQEWAGSSVSFLITENQGARAALPKKFGKLKPLGGTGTTGKTEDRFFPELDQDHE